MDWPGITVIAQAVKGEALDEHVPRCGLRDDPARAVCNRDMGYGSAAIGNAASADKVNPSG